ncbi:MAG: transcriptional repressor [Gammaproteobacteria bacterium]|nr:transcriptional repressor [Gammaproteobacteria bacterium]MCF6362402.1 transcriptional repressor [Gammaproteobacteria bacterium]
MVGNSDKQFGGDVSELLANHGISPTQQRRQIARIMFARPQHLSAEQILERVNTKDHQVSKATVYNTLGLFTRKGLIREVVVDPSKIFYDSNTRPHHHYFNLSTGMLSDIDGKQMTLSQLPKAPDGTELEGIDIIVRLRNKS